MLVLFYVNDLIPNDTSNDSEGGKCTWKAFTVSVCVRACACACPHSAAHSFSLKHYFMFTVPHLLSGSYPIPSAQMEKLRLTVFKLVDIGVRN